MPKKTFKRVNHKDPYDRFMECSKKMCKSEDDLVEAVYKKVGSGNKKWDRAYKKLQVCRTRKCKKEEKASGDWLRSL